MIALPTSLSPEALRGPSRGSYIASQCMCVMCMCVCVSKGGGIWSSLAQLHPRCTGTYRTSQAHTNKQCATIDAFNLVRTLCNDAKHTQAHATRCQHCHLLLLLGMLPRFAFRANASLRSPSRTRANGRIQQQNPNPNSSPPGPQPYDAARQLHKPWLTIVPTENFTKTGGQIDGWMQYKPSI